MKALRIQTRAYLAVPVLVAAVMLVADFTTSLAAPAQVWHRKGGLMIPFALPMGGWGSTAPEHFYVEAVPATVMKELKDGSLFIHDSDNDAPITIGTGDDPLLPPTVVLFTGTASVLDEGIWVPVPDQPGWYSPSEERMNWHFMATVTEVATGKVWKLDWQFVMRDGEWNETYRFEPVK